MSLVDAVTQNDLARVTAVLSEGGKAEINSTNANGETPLQIAVKAKNLAMAELLLKSGAGVNQASEERGTTRGYTAAHFAARNGDVDAIALLHAFKADLDRAAADGWAPIHTACFAGKSASMKKLIESGANPDARNEHGMTPIVFASNHGRAADVRFLIQRGANPAFIDAQGDTLMHHALHFRLQEMFEGEYDMPECQYDVVVALAINGAPVDKSNYQGKDAFHYIGDDVPALKDVLKILSHNREKLIAAGGSELNYISLLHAPVQAFIAMGLDGQHAKDLFESMKKCDEQRLADKKRREEDRPQGGCPVMKGKKNKTSKSADGASAPAGHPPVDMSTVPEGTDPSNGQCPFFQRKAKQEEHSAAATAAPSAVPDSGKVAPAQAQAPAPQPAAAKAQVTALQSDPKPAVAFAPQPPALTWAYIYENRTVILLMALSFFFGTWFEQRFGVRR